MEGKDIDKYLDSIVIGVQYRQHFIIQDKLGEIVDSILYADNSYFNPSVFPFTQEGVGQKRLVSANDARDSLSIGHTDVVLDMGISNKENIKSNLGDIITNYEKQIIKGVIDTYKIDQIDVADLKMNFSKKLPIEKALLEKKYDDYENVIYNAAVKSGDKRLYLSVDYQHIFDPPADDIQDVKYGHFMKVVSDYNSQKLIQWINYYEK
jgi:hypothetical protein